MMCVKRMWARHWNCIPWFVCGLLILIKGNIGRFAYGLTWLSVLVLLWLYCPTTSFKSLEEKEHE